MKILHIINNLGSGGAEKLIEEMLPLLNEEKNVEAEVLLLTDKNNVFDKSLKEKGIKVNIVPIRRIKSPMNIFFIKIYIQRGNYDIIHAHLFPTLYWVSIASKFILKNRPKFVYTEHSTNNRRRKKSIFRPLERWIYSEFDNVISISKNTQDNLVEWLHLKESELGKFIVINNGVNIGKFKNAKPYKREELNKAFNSNTKLICMVGRFTEAKDQGTLIKAMKYVANNVHLVLVGEGPLKKQNEDITKKLDVDNRVHFLGFRDDIEKILKTCDILVLSSHWEGLSLASIEAMSSGRPFIGSKVQGLEEIVCDYGLTFDEYDYHDLSKGINKLLNNYKFYDSISKRCLERANDFDIKSMIKSMISIYYQD